MRLLLIVLATLFSLAYPLLVYFGVQHLGPAFFALVLAVLAALKFATANDKKDIVQILVLVIAIVFSVALAVTNNEFLLRLYPVTISLVVALIFLSSLRQPENILLRSARLAGKKMSAQAPQYTQALTLVWAVVLLVNAIIALYLALFGTLGQWAFYCGFLSYVIFALFFAVELLYRRFYIDRHQTMINPAMEKRS